MRTKNLGRLGCVALALLAGGCDPEPMEDWLRQTEPAAPVTKPARTTSFDPADGGTVAGRVIWGGGVPTAEPFRYFRFVQGQGFVWGAAANPNLPMVDPTTGGVAGAVVRLRGPGLRAGRPWDHPPVTVELADAQIRVLQGDRPAGNVGFVSAGDDVEVVSRGPGLGALRGRGEAFFSLKMPTADRPMRRTLGRPGLVELSGAADDFWARAYLFVGEHPYVTLTDPDGGFELPGVPPGEYELVCWLPNWEVARQERDPETGSIARQWYAAPLESVARVSVTRDGVAVHEFTIPAP